jgi:hypothetical protein
MARRAGSPRHRLGESSALRPCRKNNVPQASPWRVILCTILGASPRRPFCPSPKFQFGGIRRGFRFGIFFPPCSSP